ncbi:MAG: cytochrome c [Flavipsychrobacter sp.]|nr:cytochrome c [Flavipsychrobacter sp.]
MNKKNIMLLMLAASTFIYSCGGGEEKSVRDETPDPGKNEYVDPNKSTNDKGIGKFTNVELTHPLDANMVKEGTTVYDVKCGSCHKLTDEKLVGPGWKGVTDRRTPEWIMNFVTNVDEMLDKDAEAKAMMEVCMVRMPNQNLSDAEARNVLEYMRHNDGKN